MSFPTRKLAKSYWATAIHSTLGTVNAVCLVWTAPEALINWMQLSASNSQLSISFRLSHSRSHSHTHTHTHTVCLYLPLPLLSLSAAVAFSSMQFAIAAQRVEAHHDVKATNKKNKKTLMMMKKKKLLPLMLLLAFGIGAETESQLRVSMHWLNMRWANGSRTRLRDNKTDRGRRRRWQRAVLPDQHVFFQSGFFKSSIATTTRKT